MEKAPLFRGYGEHGGIRDQSYRAWLDRRIHLRSVGRIWLLGVALLLTFVFREELKISILFNESMRGTKPSDWNDVGAHFILDSEKDTTCTCNIGLRLLPSYATFVSGPFKLSMPVSFCAGHGYEIFSCTDSR